MSSSPNLDSVTTINEDGSRRFVHPADVAGKYTNWRTFIGWFLIIVYLSLPWIKIGGNPAVFLDTDKNQFHFFGMTFVGQDLWLGFFALTGVGFSLFFITALLGRIWCGWGCPQTVFLDLVCRRIERWIEGDATHRRQLDDAPWTPEKTTKRVLKHAAFILVSLGISHLFLAYFISLPSLFHMMSTVPTEHWSAFVFVFVFGGILYFDFAWFREQFCIIMCPYGRLQSVLIDDDSIVIGYDKTRGEPRGKAGTEGAGDCVDCMRCVQVCPTGIDIRQGLQMECVSCANCIDACDAIMDKLGRPRGLVRYDSMNALAGKVRKIFRPRILAYCVFLTVGAVVASISASGFKPLTVSVLRMTGASYYLNEGTIRNQYFVKLLNKENRPVNCRLRVWAEGKELQMAGLPEMIQVDALGEVQRPLIVSMPMEKFDSKFRIHLDVFVEGGEVKVETGMPFLGPGHSSE